MSEETSLWTWSGAMAQILKYSAAFSIGSMLASILTSIVLFSTWGLGFAEIASIDDIFLGGIRAATTALGHYMIPLAPMVLLASFKDRFSDSNLMQLGFLVVAIASSAILFWEMIGVALSIEHGEHIGPPRFALSTAAFLTIVLYTLVGRFSNGARQTKFVIVFLLSSFLVTDTRSAQFGVPGVLALSESRECEYIEYVVWLGSKTVITSCGPTPFTRDDAFFVKPRDGLSFESYGALLNRLERTKRELADGPEKKNVEVENEP